VTDHEALEMMRQIAQGFDTHDLEAIMSHFADDAVFDAPRGPDAWGRRVTGRAAIRDAFADRFGSIPDVRYLDDTHFAAGNRGASQWTLSGTTTDGVRLEIRGCDLWTFANGRVVTKDSYWKIRTSPPA
jgi:ketosteroid isomerase-like protein